MGLSKAMKIGIDISQIIYGTGVSVYTRNLVEALLRVDRKNEYVFFGGSLRQRQTLDKFIQNCSRTGRVLPISPVLADFLWNRLHILPIEKLVGSVDVFHSSDWTQPPTRAAKVTTVHDLSFLRWPDSVRPRVLAVQKRRLAWVKKEVDRIIAVSQATRKEIIDLLGISEKKIVVIYEGPPRDVVEFARSTSALNDRKELKALLKVSKPYFFAYGSPAPRKNIKRLLKAFSRIRKEVGCQLVIVGQCQPKQKLPPGVIVTGFLSRDQMLSLFADAQALVFPSLYEGFGLVILEAFVLRVPVVTASVSSMAEVAGKAAVLVDPLDPNAIAEGMVKAMRDRRKLIKAGSKRAGQFSWEKAARETLKVYEKAYGL